MSSNPPLAINDDEYVYPASLKIASKTILDLIAGLKSCVLRAPSKSSTPN